MTRDRYIFLEKHYEEKLTSEEVAEGWHWCDDWDFMLVGPGMSELAYCHCILSERGETAQQEAIKQEEDHRDLEPGPWCGCGESPCGFHRGLDELEYQARKEKERK